MRAEIIDRSDKIDKIIDTTGNKLEMFMGHKVRAKVQDDRVKQSFEWVKEGMETERVAVYLDFKR